MANRKPETGNRGFPDPEIPGFRFPVSGLRSPVVLLFLLSACQETKTIHLTFGASPATRTPIGFRCRDDSGKFLAARALSNRMVKIAVLIDFVGLGGLPTCRTGDILAFCESHGCTPLTDPPRVCFDLAKSVSVDDAPVKAIGELLASLEGMPVASDAPHDPVLIRAVATAQSCAEVGSGAPAADELVGCAVSCPVQLDGVSGDVLLDLPTLSDSCAAGVVACAEGSL